MSSIFGNAMPMTEKSLNFLWAKQQVTLNNLANNDTPGYKAKYVTFEEEFRKRLTDARAGTSADIRRAINSAGYTVHDTANETARLDGNNVVVDSENVELVRSALQYQYVINSFNSDVTRLRTVIKG